MKFKQLCARTQPDMPGGEWFPLRWGYPDTQLAAARSPWLWRRSPLMNAASAVGGEIFDAWDVACGSSDVFMR